MIVKTWVDESPLPEDFIRYESEAKADLLNTNNIKTLPMTLTGVKTIDSVKTDTIIPISGSVAFDGISAQTIRKGGTYSFADGAPAAFSAAAENARRATVRVSPDTSHYVQRVDDISATRDYYATSVSGDHRSYFLIVPTGYAGDSLIIEEHGPSVGFAGTYFSVMIGTSYTLGPFDARGYTGACRHTYIDLSIYPFYDDGGMGTRTIRLIDLMSDSSSALRYQPVVIARRCRHPISENDPIKILNETYTNYSSKALTALDYIYYRIS